MSTTYVIGRNLPIILGLEDWLGPGGNNLQVKVELTRTSGSLWETILSASNNNTIYYWKVTGPSATNAYFKYSDPDDPSVYFNSDYFNISNSGGSSNYYTIINGELVTITEYNPQSGGLIIYVDSSNNLNVGINNGTYNVSAV